MSQTLLDLMTISPTHLMATAQATVAAIDNPMDGLVPDFSIFGTEFNTLWKQLLAAAWAIAIIASVFYLMRGLVSMNQHQNTNHPAQLREARSEAKTAGISLAGLAALPVIVGAILTVMS